MVAKAATKAGEFFCFHCGKQVQKTDSKCDSCGSVFDKVTEAFRCPRCSNLLPIGAAACPACGLGFKVRTINTGPKLSEDDKFLMKLIDWGKPGAAPPPKPQVVRAVKTPPPPPAGVPSPKTQKSPSQPAPTSIAVSIKHQASVQKPPIAEAEPIRVQVAAPVSTPEPETRESEVQEIAKTSPAVSQAEPAPVVREETAQHSLSNQALKKLLEEREHEVIDLKKREEELARKEEHLNRKIRAYAVKKKELDELSRRLETESAAPPAPLETEESDYPAQIVDSEKEKWMKDQSKIKDGLIEIRNQMPKKSGVMITQPQMSDDVQERIEILEEKLDEVSKERNDLVDKITEMDQSKQDIVELLRILDQLLGRLPPEIIDEFSKSKDFKLYEKVLDDLNI